MAVSARRIPLSEPTFDGNEARYLQQCIEEGWVASRGRFVAEFEALFAAIHGRPDAVSTVSGTAALHIALDGLGVGPGDEVIVPALTFIATANPVRYLGATPVFVDVDPDTYGMDATLVAEAITERTKAIVPVHLFGHPVDHDALAALAGPRGIPIVEDATEALGSAYRGQACGTLGDVGAFSFNGNKVITSGGGGMLLAGDVERTAQLRHLTLQARVPGSIEYLHDGVGHNGVLSNVQAAVGLAQLERLDAKLAARRVLAQRYAAGLRDVADLRFCEEAAWAHHNFWLMSVLVDPEVAGRTREGVMTALRDAGIDSRPFFSPLPNLPPYREFAGHDAYPVARRLHAQGISIPSSSHLSTDEQDAVIAVLRGA
jgi:perosamine synthetase